MPANRLQHSAEQIARLKLRCRKTPDLIRDFILSGVMLDGNRDKYYREMPMVRGWIMDELQSRDPEAFDAWIESDLDDDALPQFFHC